MAYSLIEQSQLVAVDGSAPITDLLRRAKLAAVKLKASEFSVWVDLGMHGYKATDLIPAYRQVPYTIKFLNPYRGWLPVFGTVGETTKIYQPIDSVLTLSKTDSGYLTMPVAEEFRELVCNELEFQCDVKVHISTAVASSIVETVRNNVLEWTLKLEQAGIRGDGLTFTPEETTAAQSISVTNIHHGPVASVAHGSNVIHGVSETNSSATPQQIADAIASLLEAIQTVGPMDGMVTNAATDLSQAERELREGRVPFGRIAKAFDLLNKPGDLAIRAPGVVSRLHQLGQMIGLI